MATQTSQNRFLDESEKEFGVNSTIDDNYGTHMSVQKYLGLKNVGRMTG